MGVLGDVSTSPNLTEMCAFAAALGLSIILLNSVAVSFGDSSEWKLALSRICKSS